jgi:hypothetical protein
MMRIEARLHKSQIQMPAARVRLRSSWLHLLSLEGRTGAAAVPPMGPP